MAVRIESQGESAVVTGDLVHHPAQFRHLDWFDVADNLPRYKGFVAGGTLLRHGPAKDGPSGQ